MKELLPQLADQLAAFSPFEDKALEAKVREFATEKGLAKPGPVFHALRAATSGRENGPTLFLCSRSWARISSSRD